MGEKGRQLVRQKRHADSGAVSGGLQRCLSRQTENIWVIGISKPWYVCSVCWRGVVFALRDAELFRCCPSALVRTTHKVRSAWPAAMVVITMFGSAADQ